MSHRMFNAAMPGSQVLVHIYIYILTEYIIDLLKSFAVFDAYIVRSTQCEYPLLTRFFMNAVCTIEYNRILFISRRSAVLVLRYYIRF